MNGIKEAIAHIENAAALVEAKASIEKNSSVRRRLNGLTKLFAETRRRAIEANDICDTLLAGDEKGAAR